MTIKSKDLAGLIQIAYHTVNLVKYTTDNMALPDGWELDTMLFGQDLDGKRPFGIVVSKENEQVVAFRGTTSWSEWYQDAEIALIPTGIGRVHQGFIELYKSLIDSDGRSDWQSRLKGKETAFTGHSLGASLATYLALDQQSGNLTTFGSPKCGDEVWAQEARKTLGNSKRWVNKFDPVTMLPLSTWHVTFAHVCDSTLLNGPDNKISGPQTNHSIDRYIELLPA